MLNLSDLNDEASPGRLNSGDLIMDAESPMNLNWVDCMEETTPRRLKWST